MFEATRHALVVEACAPFDKIEVREALVKHRQQRVQTIDHVTIAKVPSQEFDVAAMETAECLVRSFRGSIEQHHADVDALKILYSRSYQQRLTEEALEELERKLRDTPAHSTPDTLAAANRQVAPAKVRGQILPLQFRNSAGKRSSLNPSGSTGRKITSIS